MAKKKTAAPTSRSYLDRLQFDPGLLNSWVAKYLRNIRIVVLLILTISILGIVSFLTLPKRLNPEVNIPIVTVVTVLPGASPEDIESLISIPLENQLRGVEGLDIITSTSTENVSAVVLQFESSVAREKALNDTQSLVDTFSDLPEDAQNPQVNALDFEDTPIWSFVITTQTDDRSLMAFARNLSNQLEELPEVDRVVMSGFENQAITVTAIPEKVQQYGLSPLALSQAIKQGLSSFPAGSVTSATNTYSLTISPSLHTIEDIRNTTITLQGNPVRLGEIADIAEKSKLNQAPTFVASHNQEAKRAITFYVYKTSSVSIDDAGEKVKVAVDKIMADKESQFTLTSLQNSSQEINDQFTDLLGEFRTTILLVFACIFLFLGLRQAIISALTVPLTFLSAFVFMNIVGQSINFLSLFAFLLALGLLVDDTIVVISAMTNYFRAGKFTPYQTGLVVWRDTIVPIWSTTLTTIWSFVPLLLSTGIIGEFIKPIPVVVTITMISSTAIAILITLPIMIVILKPQIPRRVVFLLKALLILIPTILLLFFIRQNPLLVPIALVYIALVALTYRILPILSQRLQNLFSSRPALQSSGDRLQRYMDHGVISIEGFAGWYKRKILSILSSRSARRKSLAAVICFALISFSLLPLGLVKNEFFPKSDSELLYLSLELPAGTTLEQTQAKAMPLLETLRQVSDTEMVVAEIGKSQSADGFGGSGSSNNVATFTLHLPEKSERDRTSIEIADDLRAQFKGYTEGTLTVLESSGGPPAGADLQITLSGADSLQLNTYADQVVNYLESQSGTANVKKSIKTGTSQVKFIPDPNKLADAGLSVDAVGLWLRTYASGFTLDSVTLDKSQQEKTDIIFQLSDTTPTLQGLSKLAITNQQGVSYPLLALGRLETAANPTVISREDGKRIISVTATVQQGYNTTEKNKELEAYANSLNLADGYSWKTGGVNEENKKSINSILQAMGISALLILVTMVIQFGSFRQAFIVLIVIPLAVSSVFLIFALTGTPLSFPALIGVLSLFGIVVTNSMFIVDKINLNKRQGMDLKEAIADAGASRMEPIILTKLCTVLGLLPITIADPLWRGLGGAIISGLLISSTIMLLFIPTLYYTIYQSEDKQRRVARK